MPRLTFRPLHKHYMDYSLTYLAILMITGFIAGIINTLAGGGSNLTLPALMLTGMPADVANATNRVGVLLQCVVGVRGFHKHGKLDNHDMLPVLVPSLIGGLIGSIAVILIPVVALKPILLGTMIIMALVILIFPTIIAPPEGTPTFKIKERPLAWLGLFVAGLYGGFVQAGVGFILILALAGTLRYDLARANALKLWCSLVFTSLAALVFLIDDLILWVPGLVLACGTMLGAHIAVRFALNVEQKVMKWFLFLMTLVASLAAMFPVITI